jgi:hypothetical protein
MDKPHINGAHFLSWHHESNVPLESADATEEPAAIPDKEYWMRRTTRSDEELAKFVTDTEIEAKMALIKDGDMGGIPITDELKRSLAIRRAVIAKYGDRILGGFSGVNTTL